jgi:hypothetical protein
MAVSAISQSPAGNATPLVVRSVTSVLVLASRHALPVSELSDAGHSGGGAIRPSVVRLVMA